MKMTTNFPSPNWISSINKINLIALIFSLAIIGCNKDEEESLISETDLCLVEINGIFEEVELNEDPEYLNEGTDGLISAISDELTYPAEARANGIEGPCIINFEITEDGTTENIEIKENPGGGIGESAALIIESVTEGISFNPGILNGNPVRVKKELVFNYKLGG